jgi:ATP-dependent phosphofructokinase / diphosphate-dependent phosphofructokinase
VNRNVIGPRDRPSQVMSGRRQGLPGRGDQQNDMSTTRRIGILTGGGDVPGLNAAIKSVTYRATELGWEVVGVRRGWKGLTHLQPGVAESEAEYLVPLDRLVTRTIDRTGGTWLHSSRTNPRKMKRSALPAHVSDALAEQMRVGEDRYDMTPVVLRNMEALGLDYLIPIGGDDTLSYSQILHDAGANLIAIPKTMDNDVQGTEYCIGFSTAITRARDAINRQRSTIGSHERIGVFRIFGRDAGFTALYSAFVTSGRCLIPEAPYDVEALAAVLASDHATNPSHYAFVITAEGAIWEGGSIAEVGEADAFGHRHKANVAEILAAEIKSRTGIDTVHSDLTYDLRSGEPDTVDQMVGMVFGNTAVELVAEGQRGRMMAIREGRYSHAPLPDPELGAVSVDVDLMYDRARFRPRYDGLLGRPLMLGHGVAPLTE